MNDGCQDEHFQLDYKKRDLIDYNNLFLSAGNLSLEVKGDIVILPYQFQLSDQLSYLPTPPHGQDMTQGQFLSGV